MRDTLEGGVAKHLMTPVAAYKECNDCGNGSLLEKHADPSTGAWRTAFASVSVLFCCQGSCYAIIVLRDDDNCRRCVVIDCWASNVFRTPKLFATVRSIASHRSACSAKSKVDSTPGGHACINDVMTVYGIYNDVLKPASAILTYCGHHYGWQSNIYASEKYTVSYMTRC